MEHRLVFFYSLAFIVLPFVKGFVNENKKSNLN